MSNKMKKKLLKQSETTLQVLSNESKVYVNDEKIAIKKSDLQVKLEKKHGGKISFIERIILIPIHTKSDD